MLLTLLRPSLLIQTWAQYLWQTKAVLQLVFSIRTTRTLLCSIFNFSLIFSSFSFNVLLLFLCCHFVWEMVSFFISCYIKAIFLFRTWWCGNAMFITPRLNTWLYSGNYAFLSFLIISSSIFTIIWSFREIFAKFIIINKFWITRYNLVIDLYPQMDQMKNGDPVHSPLLYCQKEFRKYF